MNKGLISGVVLLVIGLVCGLLLAVVNSFTSVIIKANEDAIVLASLNEVYEGSGNYDLDIVNGSGAIDKIYVLRDKLDDSIVAIVYSVKAFGYQSDIKMLIAVEKNDQSALVFAGYKVLSQAETPGIGDVIIGYDFKMDGQLITNIDAFAGPTATFTSNAVKTCFQLVSARVAADFGGIQS
jgi:Na+-translocating ferredoxin:NAD+ oxidoreductase RnfG subunit